MKLVIFRIVLGFFILTLWYMSAWLWSIPLIVWLSVRVRPFELVIYGLLIDAQFMMYQGLPYYTLGSCAWFFVVEWLKPHLALYTHRV